MGEAYRDPDEKNDWDFGSGVYGTKIGHSAVCPFKAETSGLCGVSVWHKHPDGKWCGGGVLWCLYCNGGKDHPLWTLIQLEPLTLAPSILDPTCGLHGYIREGKWVGC